MNRQTIIIFVILFVLLIVGMFIFTSLQKDDTTEDLTTNTEEKASEETDTGSVVMPTKDIIDAKHFYLDGVHTLVGEVTLPTPCDLLESKASVMESDPEQVLIEFTTINTAETCTQVLTNQRFSVEAQASEKADLSATFNGQPIQLNLIPAAPGETPDDFEVYYKG